ncbi:MAG: exodeoxyribonuclease VII large subunit [Bacteroidota bacterium]|nr:exodeoxyribonuclease VII large subunit [Bacteroidota bacterium]
MAETIDGKKIFSLLEVTSSIQKTLALRYTSSFWVTAEMNKLNYYPRSGHCYPDLVEKIDGKVIAQLKSTLWRDDYNRINDRFISVVKSPLKDGIRMLFCARVTFDPMHGLALRITDIDPVFSLGELEREKQESIALLKKEGLFDLNRSLPFPLLPKRLAIISIETSKGYADFRKMIDGNPYGYRFNHLLFPSLLQGDRAIESILSQLARIRKVASRFDVVAIIRGGGGEVGLSCFNDFGLSREIARFPLPVITGIGHATNETVVEMVAYRNAITPTELAGYLLQKFHDFAVPVRRAQEILASRAAGMIADERRGFFHTMKFFRSVTSNVLLRSRHDIHTLGRELLKQSNMNLLRQEQFQAAIVARLRGSAHALRNHHYQYVMQCSSLMRKAALSFIRQEKTSLENVIRTVSNMHPQNVLKRGYSITRLNGKALSAAAGVNASNIIETTLADGTIISEVTSTKPSSPL